MAVDPFEDQSLKLDTEFTKKRIFVFQIWLRCFVCLPRLVMLLRFAFANFLSIRDRQELLLTASALKDQPAHLLTSDTRDARAARIVPITVIYGANASGKTNVLLGLRYIVNTILHSHTRRSPSGGTSVRPFRLDDHSLVEPSRFDVDFVLSGVRYHFGFEETSESVTEEWLFAYPKGRRQERYHHNANIGPITFGSALGGRNRTIEELMRPNSLFISTAAQTITSNCYLFTIIFEIDLYSYLTAEA